MTNFRVLSIFSALGLLACAASDRIAPRVECLPPPSDLSPNECYRGDFVCRRLPVSNTVQLFDVRYRHRCSYR